MLPQRVYGDRATNAARKARGVGPRHSLEPDCRRRTGRQRARIDLDHAARQAHAIGDELLRERRRRTAVLQSVLVAVPGAGHATVDDAALAERPVLVGAEIRERADLAAVAEHRNAFAAARRDDAGAPVRDGIWRPDQG